MYDESNGRSKLIPKPDFPMYLAHVASIVSAICPSCAQITCLACGGRSNHVAPGQAFWAAALASGAETEEGEKGKGKGKGKARGDGEGAGIEVESLLHCSDLQVGFPFTQEG